jgi:rod shape-determining protein MreB
MDEALVRHLDANDRLLIGPETAETAKIACGSALPLEEELETDVAGRDRLTGLLRRTTVDSTEIRAALETTIETITEAVIRTLESTPPELAADISNRGMVLAGGGGLLRGIDRRLAAETHVPVALAEAPLECVALGAGASLEERTGDLLMRRRPWLPVRSRSRRRRR